MSNQLNTKRREFLAFYGGASLVSLLTGITGCSGSSTISTPKATPTPVPPFGKLKINRSMVVVNTENGKPVIPLCDVVANSSPIKGTFWGNKDGRGNPTSITQSITYGDDPSKTARTRYDSDAMPTMIHLPEDRLVLTIVYQGRRVVWRLYKTDGTFVGSCQIMQTTFGYFLVEPLVQPQMRLEWSANSQGKLLSGTDISTSPLRSQPTNTMLLRSKNILNTRVSSGRAIIEWLPTLDSIVNGESDDTKQLFREFMQQVGKEVLTLNTPRAALVVLAAPLIGLEATAAASVVASISAALALRTLLSDVTEKINKKNKNGENLSDALSESSDLPIASYQNDSQFPKVTAVKDSPVVSGIVTTPTASTPLVGTADSTTEINLTGSGYIYKGTLDNDDRSISGTLTTPSNSIPLGGMIDANKVNLNGSGYSFSGSLNKDGKTISGTVITPSGSTTLKGDFNYIIKFNMSGGGYNFSGIRNLNTGQLSDGKYTSPQGSGTFKNVPDSSGDGYVDLINVG
jgi:hypothetical protein